VGDSVANVTVYPGVVLTTQNMWFLDGYFQVEAPLTFGYLELGSGDLTLKANFTVASLVATSDTVITSPFSTVGLNVTSSTNIQSGLTVTNTTLWLNGASSWADGDIYIEGTHGFIISYGTFSWQSGSPDLYLDDGGTFINYGIISIDYTSSEIIIEASVSSSTGALFINGGTISFPNTDAYLEVSDGVLFHQCSSGTLSFNIVDSSSPPYIEFFSSTPVLGNPILDGTITVTFASPTIASDCASAGCKVLEFSAAPNGANYDMFDGNLATNIASTLVLCYDVSSSTGTGSVYSLGNIPSTCNAVPIIGSYHNDYCVSVPQSPTAPSTPVAPTPVAPVAPVTPVAPTPVAPVAPVAPATPTSPKAPSPVTPGSPSTPTKPTGPANPTAPQAPSPVTPGSPSTPAKPTGPVTPSAPTPTAPTASTAGKLVCASLLLLVSFTLVL